MNDTTRQVGGALGVALLGTLMNSNYLHQVGNIRDMAVLPAQTAQMVRQGVEGAHMAGQLTQDTGISEAVTQGANAAFTSGMAEALAFAAIIMVVAALITFAILPARSAENVRVRAILNQQNRSPTAPASAPGRNG